MGLLLTAGLMVGGVFTYFFIKGASTPVDSEARRAEDAEQIAFLRTLVK